MKIYKLLLFALITALTWSLYVNFKTFSNARNGIDDLGFSLKKIKKYIPESAKVYYASNYTPNPEAVSYFQAQHAIAPIVLAKAYQKEWITNDYLLLFNSSDSNSTISNAMVQANNLDTLCSIKMDSQNLIIYLLKKIE